MSERISRRTLLIGGAGVVVAGVAGVAAVEAGLLPGRTTLHSVLGLNGEAGVVPDIEPGPSVSGEFVSSNPKLKLAREFDTGEQYGMAVKKDGNIPLLRRINSTLADLREDGTYDKIFDKYFG